MIFCCLFSTSCTLFNGNGYDDNNNNKKSSYKRKINNGTVHSSRSNRSKCSIMRVTIIVVIGIRNKRTVAQNKFNSQHKNNSTSKSLFLFPIIELLPFYVLFVLSLSSLHGQSDRQFGNTRHAR